MPDVPVARPVTLALIDDHPVVLEGVQSWIARDPQQRVHLIASGASIEDILTGPGRSADVLVLDLNLAGRSAVDQIAGLTAAGHRVVVFSQETDERAILAVMGHGAHAYIAKAEGGDHFVETVVAAALDRPYVTPTVAGAMWADQDPSRPKLSARERGALLLWFQGMSKASVALRMGISVHTVTQYIDRARIKYTSAGRPGPTKTALLARAIEDGLISPEEVTDYQSRAAQPP